MNTISPARNAFSVDLEDWYHGIELPYDSWPQYTDRLFKGVDPLLDMLDRHNVKGTFFTLGWIVERYPDLIKRLAASGHELASHGFTHEKVYNLSPEAFREEVRRTKRGMEDLTGQEVKGFRAPFFSVTNKSLWALDILKEEGYSYDCSISPVKTWRYGISSCPDKLFRIRENGLIEFPVSTYQFLGKRLSIGGAYFRLFPYQLVSRGIRQRAEAGQYTMFYIHPWEYDPEHPVVPMEWKARLTHYTRLTKTLPYTGRMLSHFAFDTVDRVIQTYAAQHSLDEVSLDLLKD